MPTYNGKSPSASPVYFVSGQYLAKNRLGKRARARLAADIISGKAGVIEHTVKQVSAMCRVSRPYIIDARTPAMTRLLRDWNAAGHEARVEFARAVGAERVFDVISEVVG
jgi:hypothetical protein